MSRPISTEAVVTPLWRWRQHRVSYLGPGVAAVAFLALLWIFSPLEYLVEHWLRSPLRERASVLEGDQHSRRGIQIIELAPFRAQALPAESPLQPVAEVLSSDAPVSSEADAALPDARQDWSFDPVSPYAVGREITGTPGGAAVDSLEAQRYLRHILSAPRLSQLAMLPRDSVIVAREQFLWNNRQAVGKALPGWAYEAWRKRFDLFYERYILDHDY